MDGGSKENKTTKYSYAIEPVLLPDKNVHQTFVPDTSPSLFKGKWSCGPTFKESLIFPRPFFLEFKPLGRLITFSLLSFDRLAVSSFCLSFGCSTGTALRGVRGSLTFTGKHPNSFADPAVVFIPGSIESSPESHSPPVLLLKARTAGTGLGVLVADEGKGF